MTTSLKTAIKKYVKINMVIEPVINKKLEDS